MNELRCACAGAVGAVILVAIAVHAQPSGVRPQVPISYAQWRHLKDNPEALQQLGKDLPDVAQSGPLPGPPSQAPLGSAPSPFSPEGAPTVAWTNLLNTPPGGPFALSNPLLLTDGSVLVHRTDTPFWYKLTPTDTGSYVNGTWSTIAPMPLINGTLYVPKFFASSVLPDGRVIIEGGEYLNGSEAWTTLGAIYNPGTDTWTPMTPPSGWALIGDAAGTVLPNGAFMLSSCCDVPFHAALLDPTSLTWSTTGSGKADRYDEESWNLLPDGTMLTVDAYTTSIGSVTCGTNTERYTPATGAWSGAGTTPSALGDCSAANAEGSSPTYEIGPNQMTYNGTAIAFGGNTANVAHSALYNTATNTWSAGPNLPTTCGSVGNSPCTMADAPSTIMPNGNVLIAASAGAFHSPANFFEFNPSTNAFTPAPGTSDAASITAFYVNFLNLPTGQVLAVETYTHTIQIYTPSGTYQGNWQPTVTSAPSCVIPNSTYTLSGTQLSGLSEGAMYGDDVQGATNYPIVRIVNNLSGHVSYGRTYNHSSRSIAVNAASSTSFQVAAAAETGASTLFVVANGIPSAGTAITVDPTCTLTADSVTPSAGTGASQVFQYKFSHPLGYANIAAGLILVTNTAASVTNACLVVVVPNANQVWLVNDAADGALGPATIGTSTFLENGHCIVDAANSSWSGAGRTLTVNAALLFKSNFTGAKTNYMEALDFSDNASPLMANGTWTPANATPTDVSVTPSSGTGASQTFSYVFADQNGASDISYTVMVVNATLSVTNSCAFVFVRASNQFYLVNDAGNGVLGPITAGANVSVQNSQCVLNGLGSSSASAGAQLTVNAALSFKTAFAGLKNNYGQATDSASQSSTFGILGTFTRP